MKKLELSRETLRRLSASEVEAVQGGLTSPETLIVQISGKPGCNTYACPSKPCSPGD